MDVPSNGRRLKCRTIVDDFNKEATDIVVDQGISDLYVAWALDRAARSGAILRRCEPTRGWNLRAESSTNGRMRRA